MVAKFHESLTLSNCQLTTKKWRCHDFKIFTLAMKMEYKITVISWRKIGLGGLWGRLLHPASWMA